MSTNGERRRTTALAALAALLVTVTATGCITGERPTFSEGTGDAAVDRMLARLERQPSGPFTATYEVLTRATGATTAAEVTVASATRRSVTIGNWRFLTEGGTLRTCDLTAGTCVDGHEPQRVSDVQIVPDFSGTSAATQLRNDAARDTQPAVERSDTIAGQPVTCVDLTLAGGTKTYCAIAGGTLARLDAGGAAVRVELTGYTTTVASSSFGTSR